MNVKQDDKISKALAEPAVRLAWFDLPAVDRTLEDQMSAPGLLVSYVYAAPFLKNRESYLYRDWVLDSGAFSAHNSGKVIQLSEYVDFCLKLLAEDPTLTEVFALDVIPKSPAEADVGRAMEASVRNTEEMWRQGVPAVPCFHCGEPEEALAHIAGKYPKIALGGMVKKGGGIMSQDDKFRWLEQCFARVWPKRIHGFGVSAERMVYGLPFHSVDATNWEIGPCAFGNWQKFGAMSVRGSDQDLRSQVRHYLAMEARARVRWGRQMAELEALPDRWPPARATRPDGVAVRLALNGPRVEAGTTGLALGESGQVRPAAPPVLAEAKPAKDYLNTKWWE
jgi:hypothetical protein